MEAWDGGEREREREKEDSREDEEKRLRTTTTTTTTTTAAYNRALLSLALRRVVAGHTTASNDHSISQTQIKPISASFYLKPIAPDLGLFDYGLV